MASVSNVTLTISAAVHSRSCDVTVEYDVTFDDSDIASDQPYRETIRLVRNDIGDPAGAILAAPEERLTTMVPGLLLFPSAIRASGSPVPVVHRKHTRKRMSTIILDENKPPVPDPSKIRAVIILEPLSALGTELPLPRTASSH